MYRSILTLLSSLLRMCSLISSGESIWVRFPAELDADSMEKSEEDLRDARGPFVLVALLFTDTVELLLLRAKMPLSPVLRDSLALK